MNQPATRYTGTAIALHWLMALAIVGNFCLGWYMSDLHMSLLRLKLFNYHKWAGITILFLAALRLLWRLANRPPIEDAKPMVDTNRMRTLPPFEVRLVLEDGNFGGRYQRDDAEMLEIWGVAVQETRALLEGW